MPNIFDYPPATARLIVADVLADPDLPDPATDADVDDAFARSIDRYLARARRRYAVLSRAEHDPEPV